MSKVSEILEEINVCLKLPFEIELVRKKRLIKRIQALLSSHAVITEKTADIAEVSIMLGVGHGDESVEIRKELTRIRTHKGK